MRNRPLLLLVALLAAASVACIWDTDTLEDELLGLPEARDLVVTGRWVRHGRAYHEKRVREIPARIEKTPADLDLYDDLAVAHDRLGDPAAALAVMERKARALEASPDEGHRYRLLANRGTFLAHAGRYDEGAADLERAVAMNPESHFGRERFQIALVKYLGAAKKEPGIWKEECFLSYAHLWVKMVRGTGDTGDRMALPPMDSRYSFRDAAPPGAARGLPMGSTPPDPALISADEALAAIQGMLRFEGPGEAELYRTLGDVLLVRGTWMTGDLHLAWWAYHRALGRGHPAADPIRASIAGIESHWAGAEVYRWNLPTEEGFGRVKANGETWLRAFQNGEATAVARGESPGDPEVEKRLTAAADAFAGPVPDPGPPPRTLVQRLYPETRQERTRLVILLFEGSPAVAIGLFLFLRWRRRRAARAA